jgi:hypothetical protein
MRTALTSTLSKIPYSWRLGITVAAALLVVVGVFMASTGPASAAPPISTQGDDYAFINSSGNLVVCDVEADGHGVYAEWRTASGTGLAWDHNGSKSPCYEYGPVREFRVCEDVWGPDWCGDWV